MQASNDCSDFLQLAYSISETKIKDQTAPVRQQGILKRIQMPWQIRNNTLFQFKQLYTDRLKQLKKAFKNSQNISIQELNSQQNACELIGLFKRIQAKRIRAFQQNYQQKYSNHKKLFEANDTFQLEDQTGKTKLQIRNSTNMNNQMSNKAFFRPIYTPYGVVFKCQGQYSARINRFIVSNVQTPSPAPQKPAIIYKNEKKFMLIVNQPSLQELIRVQKHLQVSISQMSMNICELVIIGGMNTRDINQIRNFDSIINSIHRYVDTFIIPSSGQQRSCIYPLSPISKNLLQQSLLQNNVGNCSNPQILQSNIKQLNINTLISCGQNILNLKANCDIQDELEIMKLIIEYRHLCPSSAFSLPIQSYDYDPLVLKETPHIMVHGKCMMFNTESYQATNRDGINVRTRLVALSEGDMAIVNLSDDHFHTQQIRI